MISRDDFIFQLPAHARYSSTIQIIDILYNIFVACHGNEQYIELAARCLETLSEYIGWVDIELVASERSVALYVQCTVFN